MTIDSALSRLRPDDLCIVVLKKTGQRRQAVWVPALHISGSAMSRRAPSTHMRRGVAANGV
jgi:hypothetical protein